MDTAGKACISSRVDSTFLLSSFSDSTTSLVRLIFITCSLPHRQVSLHRCNTCSILAHCIRIPCTSTKKVRAPGQFFLFYISCRAALHDLTDAFATTVVVLLWSSWLIRRSSTNTRPERFIIGKLIGTRQRLVQRV